MTPSTINVGPRAIGPGLPVFVVAEMSGNHNGSFDRALALLRAAHAAGADAVKLQTYTPESITIDHDGPPFRIDRGPWAGRSLHDLYAEAHMPWEWQPDLLRAARDLGFELFSTPFDPTAVAFLDGIGVRAFKIASFEIVDLPLIAVIARTKKPMLISTGMATLADIEAAVSTARAEGNDQIVLLRCTSAYPADPGEMDLLTIPNIAETFGVPVGLSDHTLGVTAAVAAVALGACVVEKHFTLRRADGGPDAAFSLEADELAELVRQVRIAERARGSVRYGPTSSERDSLSFRRSLFVVADVRRGDVLTPENVRSIRPAGGLAPRHLADVLGRRARVDLRRGTPLAWDLIA